VLAVAVLIHGVFRTCALERALSLHEMDSVVSLNVLYGTHHGWLRRSVGCS
jgi:hypothetical protein